MTAGIKIIRRSSFTAVPWKNGGGITHEAIRVPPSGDSFLWRVSVAQIDSSGPFSDFTGYQRKMVLLRGQGIALEFGGGQRSVLRGVGDWLEFDGATPPRGELLDGPCMDLNLMACNSLRITAGVERVNGPLQVAAAPGETTLIFGIRDPWCLDGTESLRLEPWDLAILEGCSAQLRNMSSRGNSAPGAVFIATITP